MSPNIQAIPVALEPLAKKAPRSWERGRPRLPMSKGTNSINGCCLGGTRAGEDACAPRTVGPFCKRLFNLSDIWLKPPSKAFPETLPNNYCKFMTRPRRADYSPEQMDQGVNHEKVFNHKKETCEATA